MFKPPLCPYCSGGFTYSQVKKSIKEKTCLCPHCKKTFGVKTFAPRLVLYLSAAILAVGGNLLLMHILPYITVPVLAVNTMLFLLAAWLLTPYAVSYTEIETENAKRKDEKNNAVLPRTAPAPGKAPSRKAVKRSRREG